MTPRRLNSRNFKRHFVSFRNKHTFEKWNTIDGCISTHLQHSLGCFALAQSQIMNKFKESKKSYTFFLNQKYFWNNHERQIFSANLLLGKKLQHKSLKSHWHFSSRSSACYRLIACDLRHCLSLHLSKNKLLSC